MEKDYEKIKTFEDAVSYWEDPFKPILMRYHQDIEKHGIEFAKLDIIAAAIRGCDGIYPSQSDFIYTPNFNIITAREMESLRDGAKKNIVQFKMNDGSTCGFFCAKIDAVPINEVKTMSDMIFTLSENAALYLGNQFTRLWVDYITTIYKL